MVCQADFAGMRGVSITDESGKANVLMRYSERALPDKRLVWMKHSADAINFGDLKGFFDGQLWENGGQPTSKGPFPRFSGATHQDTMPSTRCNLQGAFDMILSKHGRHVVLIECLAFAIEHTWIEYKRLDLLFVVEVSKELGERLDGVDRDAPHKGCFHRVSSRYKDSGNQFLRCQSHQGQDAFGGAQASVGSKFAEEEAIF